MVAHRFEAVVGLDHSVVVKDVPFSAGERVSVVVLPAPTPRGTDAKYPLRGRPYKFDDPVSPIGVEDWDALK